MTSKELQIISYSLIIAWFALVFFFNLFKHIIEKIEERIEKKYWMTRTVNIIEHRIHPVKFQAEFMFDEDNNRHFQTNQDLKMRGIKEALHKIVERDDFIRCVEIKEENSRNRDMYQYASIPPNLTRVRIHVGVLNYNS